MEKSQSCHRQPLENTRGSPGRLLEKSWNFHCKMGGRSVYSDHKPMQSIFKNLQSSKTSSERMRTLGYDVEVIYQQGNQQAISDTLIRACPPLMPIESLNSEFQTVNIPSI